jgi:hypothetical protein
MPFTTPRGNPLFDQIFLELHDVSMYDFIATIKCVKGIYSICIVTPIIVSK